MTGWKHLRTLQDADDMDDLLAILPDLREQPDPRVFIFQDERSGQQVIVPASDLDRALVGLLEGAYLGMEDE
ncbi:MAG: hypothetical protein H6595_13880 [Flavobacteriales bacterium]|nr:hypothetical protein [Flavobacteriales bacterium]MCB9168556.1 hypothetical protein [Flavobacteriales bacterium]